MTVDTAPPDPFDVVAKALKCPKEVSLQKNLRCLGITDGTVSVTWILLEPSKGVLGIEYP